ncbi:hypothetical protein GCM10010129_14840 [Streptomyces fumigatiscleroticus]|nr:hypothetical protein GCM10010129_14840 [Streptomyces fumigatiscleroticus]
MDIALAVVGGAALVAALTTLVTGWLPPGSRGKVARPRMLGPGMLGIGFCCVTQMSSLRDLFTDAGDPGTALRLAVLFCGLVAMGCSGTRPVRRVSGDS